MLRLIQNINNLNFEHVVVCPKIEKGILKELETSANCRVINMELRPFNLRSFFKLLRLVKREKFDLIHSHGKAAGIYSRLIGKLTGTHVTHHLHGIHYQHYFPFLQLAYLKIEKFLCRWTQKIICVSESEREEGLELKLFHKSKSSVVHNGVDLQLFAPSREQKPQLKAEWGIPPDSKVMLSITRFCYQKNPELSIQIHAEVCKEHSNTYLFLIGIPEENQEIQALARSLGTEDRVILTAQQSNIHRLLNIADVYLSTSRWEGFSLGVVEAMAMELPAVISKVVGNIEILSDEQSGAFFVPEHSLEAYVETINSLFRDLKRMEELGHYARNKIKENFNLIHSAQKMEKEYMQTIGK